VSRRLQGHFDTLDQVAAEAGLSDHACARLAKARRVLGAMQATLAFFWTQIAARLGEWGYDDDVVEWLRQELIPAHYLRRVAEKAGTAQQRQRLRTLAAEVLARARSPDGLWGRSARSFKPNWKAVAPGVKRAAFSGYGMAVQAWRCRSGATSRLLRAFS